MIIYSEKIAQFVHEIRCVARAILANEVGLKLGRERFYARGNQTSYPINIVIYNNKSMLGYFNPEFYELGFHERLMHVGKDDLHDVIRHELAHYLIFIEQGGGIQPHGVEFKQFCKKMGWNDEVCKATLSLTEESSVLRKVKKLMALATSSNKHEAEQAMIKSRELLLNHNMEFVATESEQFFLKRVIKEKRESAKMRAIGKILETFFVSTVYRRAGNFTYLEILGTKTNIEIAEYVADILQFELDRLLAQTSLRGAIAKNSFFLGIAKGYRNKIQSLKKEENTNALLVIEKKLTLAKALAYPRLSSSKSSSSYCPKSSALGEQMGQNLSINPALKTSTSKKSRFFIDLKV